MWQILGFDGMLFESEWPSYDENKCIDSTIEIVAQINGKVRAKFTVPVDISSDDAIQAALNLDKIKSAVEGKNIIKKFYVKGKLVNIVAK